MPRKPREEFPGAVVHVFARGNRKQKIYLDDADRVAYLDLLGQVVLRQRWACLAYCLMKNHVHLLVETPEPNLASGMQRLHGLHAQRFNKRHKHSGHLFQGRYGSVAVQTDEHLLVAARYIALNPVEAGLCERPEDWAWSSHMAVLGGQGPAWLNVERLLGFFGMWGGNPRERYAAFVESDGDGEARASAAEIARGVNDREVAAARGNAAR